MTALRQEDRRARRRAQEEFRRPLVLEAGAGTGKTTTLVARVLAWCLGPGWEKHASVEASPPSSPEVVASRVLRRVVAITFTEAAAAEMAGRIAEELARVATTGPPGWLMSEHLPQAEELSLRARSLAGALDHLTVRTIHAFCRSLLADHPLEAGLHPLFDVDAEGLEVERVCREVVESALETAYGAEGQGEGEVAFLTLASRGVDPETLASALGRMIQEGVSPQVLEPDPLAPARIEELLHRVAAVVSRAAKAAAPLAEVNRRSKLTLETVNALEDTGRRLSAGPSLSDLLEELPDRWTDGVLGRLGDWSRGRFNKGESEALGDRAEELEAAAGLAQGLLRHLMGMDPELLQAGRKALLPLLQEAAESLRRRGVLTFSALLIQARNLLAADLEVSRRVRRGLDQLLVDEFQDTDRTQCDLIRRLALEGPEE
ncbi:MAG: UvrD-helicase domain-containing protein, partial [Acidobacteria bacterium]|nr:UvrD-helicase domain-containing protein [Acidobacteriota bacterium]